MRRTAVLTLSVALLITIAWLGTAWAQEKDLEPNAFPGRHQIIYIAAPGAENTRDKQTVLLDTMTGQTWGMRDWKQWVELPKIAGK